MFPRVSTEVTTVHHFSGGENKPTEQRRLFLLSESHHVALIISPTSRALKNNIKMQKVPPKRRRVPEQGKNIKVKFKK